MLLIIGVVAFAAALAVFALPVILVTLVVKSVRRGPNRQYEADTVVPLDPDRAFAQIVHQEWPRDISG